MVILLVVYCAVTMLVSILGGQFPWMVRLTHLRVQLMMSFVGGLMLAVALLHLLPHAAAVSGSLDIPATSAVVGLLFTFFLIRVFHVHQHEPSVELLEDGPDAEAAGESDDKISGQAHAVGSDCGHGHSHDVSHDHDHGPGSRWSWLGLAIGLSLHTLSDGVALGASVFAESGHSEGYLAGLATFLAIVLHKPLDAMAITMLMRSRSWSKKATTAINIGFSCMCPLGAMAFYFGAASLGPQQNLVVGIALGFSAGAFLCISLADLLPEIQFHSHDLAKLSTALVAGALVAFAIRLVESDHAHDMDPHDHSAHSHENGADSHENGAHSHENESGGQDPDVGNGHEH